MSNALGLDISSWQDIYSTPKQVNFDQMKLAGADFVFLKASQGTPRGGWTDRTFVEYWKNSKAAGLLRGAYHFMTWDAPIPQADHFSSLLAEDPGELPPICDYEWWKVTPANAIGLLASFIARVKQNTGLQPGIYTAPGYWQPHGSSNAFFAECPLWIAHWGARSPKVPAPWKSWEFWQETNKGDGKMYGVESKQVDVDYFNGTVEELHRKYGELTAAPPVQPEYTDAEKLAKLWTAHAELHGWV